MRIREPKTTALIFASGKMVVTGAKSEDDSKLASRKYARIIQKLGFNAKFTDFKIQNIVGSCDIKFPIRLEGLASRHHHFSSYEPELFPGLIYRMMKPKIVLLIFVSGKIVLTGAKVREEIYQAFEMIYPVLSGRHHDYVGCHYKTLAHTHNRFPKGMNRLHRTAVDLSPCINIPTSFSLACNITPGSILRRHDPCSLRCPARSTTHDLASNPRSQLTRDSWLQLLQRTSRPGGSLS